jgi:hypothetical protein
MIIRKEQMEIFRKIAAQDFENEMVEHLRSRFSEKLKSMENTVLRSLIQSGIDQAKEYKVEKRRDVRRYLECMIQYGVDFDRNKKTLWAVSILNDQGLSGTLKMNRIENYITFVLRE